MTSLVAPKPSEGTSPGLMSYGSDPSALDDYLNLDLFGPRPSNSPTSSHGPLPMTPNADAAPATVFPPLDQSPGGTLGFSDYTPLDKNFGAFPDLGLPGPSDLSEQYSTLFQDLFPTYAEPGPSAPVIDPQLFTAPPAPPAPPVESDDDSDEEIDEVAPLPARRRPKKNAAAAGGIAKRPSRASTPASIVPSYAQFEDPKPVIPPALGKGGVASYLNGERIGSQEPDEWRPTPEEYKKLSSKEKRQLRNKISARNFRVRRKEYITTLESHIADRDQLISAIRSELSLTHNENNELRREIDALKRAIQQGRLSAEDTGLPPPRPLTPEPQRRPELTRPNTQKDVSNDSRNFWGGVSGHGGVTSVHTTLIPDVFPALSGKPNSPQTLSPPSSASPSTPPNEGVNMNPLMNLSPLFGSSKSTPYAGLDVMDHAFNQRTLDGFRAQLWGRMAKEAGARSALAERSEAAPMDGDVVFSEPSEMTSPQLESSSSGSSSSASMSPQQSSSSASSPPSITLSSSPSLSMLNQPTTLRSLVESATGRTFDAPMSLFQSPTLPAVAITPPSSSPAPAVPSPALPQASVPAPALLQASSFGSNFLAAQNPSPSPSFGQNTASIQARAMLQAQWLAMQQSRQAQAQAQTPAPQPTVRETYIAQFSQAAEYQRQQLQAQQQGLNGLAAGVRPQYLAVPRSGGHYAANTDKDKKDKKLSNALEKLSLADKATAQSIKSKSPTSPKSSMPPGIKLAPGTSKSQPTKSSTIPPLKSSPAPQPTKSNSVPQPTKLATVPQPTKSNTIPQPSKSGTTPQQAAMAATIASSTLLSRMGSAFWDAFSGGSRDVDTDKVRRVLEGKAVVRVVDVDVGGLEEKMRGMSVSGDCASGATGVFSNLRGRK